MKRIRPAPMGRAFRVVKRTAHLTVRVSERPLAIAAVAAPKGRSKASAPAATTPASASPAKKSRATGQAAASKTKKK